MLVEVLVMNKNLIFGVSLILALCGMQVSPCNAKAENSQPIVISQGITYNKINFQVVDSNIPEKIQNMITNLKTNKGFIQYYDESTGYRYIAIMRGQMPTGGYSIVVKSVEDIEGRTNVVIKEIDPAPGTLVPQMVTYPTIIIKAQGITDNVTLQNLSGVKYAELAPKSDSKINKEQLTDKNWKDLKSYSDVDASKKWTIKFNKPVIEDKINLSNIYVADSEGNIVQTKILVANDKKSVSILPIKEYELGETYYIFVNKDLCKNIGNSIKGFRMQFVIKNHISIN